MGEEERVKRGERREGSCEWIRVVSASYWSFRA